MRGIGLIIAGSLAAACGGPAPEVSSNTGVELQEELAARNKVAASEPVEPGTGAEVPDAAKTVQAGPVSPCLMQGTDRLKVAHLRAVGTEPFWSARAEGRCVTYSTPENQQGVRVWTRYADGADGLRSWAGQLDGKKFEMRVRPEAGCSDGMSDQRYPLAVELTVNGERRNGCAEPL